MACNIDLVLIYLFSIVIEKVYYFSLRLINIPFDTITRLSGLTWILGSLTYFILMESSSNQATIGKIIWGLQVTDLNGTKISFFRSVGRTFAKALSIIILFFGFIMVGFTKRKQALHDILAGCLVIRIEKNYVRLFLTICILLLIILVLINIMLVPQSCQLHMR